MTNTDPTVSPATDKPGVQPPVGSVGGATPAVGGSDTPVASSPPNSDALAQLEALLQKTRANKGQSPDGGAGREPMGPSPEEIAAQAQALAQAEADKQVAFDAQMAASEEKRQQELAEQQEKMLELEGTPQYQARQQQNQAIEEQRAEEQAAHDGFEIKQVQTQKI
jgi:hypothetical protein